MTRRNPQVENLTPPQVFFLCNNKDLLAYYPKKSSSCRKLWGGPQLPLEAFGLFLEVFQSFREVKGLQLPNIVITQLEYMPFL